MADSLRETTNLLQPPATQPSSSARDVPAGSSRSSASRDRPSFGSSTASASSASASGSGTRAGTETGTALHEVSPVSPSVTGVSPDGLPPQPQRRRDLEAARLSTSSSSSLPPAAANSGTRPTHYSSHATRSGSHRTSHRHNRSSGTFLLAGALSGSGSAYDTSHGGPTHTRSGAYREPLDSRQRDKNRDSLGRGGSTRVAPETPEKKTLGSPPERAPDGGRSRHSADSGSGRSHTTTIAAGGAREGTPDSTTTAAAASPSSSSPATSGQALDLDSAQIVNMALNLSESRRFAARRNASQQIPPRLAPLPDSAVGGSLLRQLQQQRRISRNMSPRPEKPGGSRAASGQLPPSQSPRVSTSVLQPGFDPLSDGTTGGPSTYRYHFSQSTLARAQKAKDYLELLTQHRRLLELIPPLTPASSSRSRTTSLGSPPASSSNSAQLLPPFLSAAGGSGELLPGTVRLGRPYNPLQYIRNRKVRVRERKAVDGQAQGFGDVNRATDWIDEVAKWAATCQGRLPGGPALPAFSSADAATAALQNPPPPATRTTSQGVLAKPKRPRIDWVIDPADMIADVYWLEQGDNKKLVEDHHWRRVFPQDASLYRPVSQRADEGAAAGNAGDHAEFPAPFPTLTADADTLGPGLKPPPLSGAPFRTLENSPEHDHGSARKRARQKLNELRTFHHRHNSSFHSQDILRLRRGSFSDTSDSDSDRRRLGRARADSGTANGAEMLNKNMMSMIARENKEKDEYENASGRSKAQTPQNSSVLLGPSSSNSRGYNKQPTTAVTESSAMQHPPSATPVNSPSKTGRASLEIPAISRRSVDYDSSRPTSPELGPISKEGLGFVPPLGGDLSPPPSRAASPPRHRFNKVKNMFRDHSRERERELANSSAFDRGSQEREDYTELHPAHTQLQQQPQEAVETLSAPLTATTSATGDLKFTSSHEGNGPHSPVRKVGSRTNAGTFDSYQTYGSITGITSLRHHSHHRSEESGSSGTGLRGFFKGGPRIDTMLRSGASKVSDMLWRREGSELHLGDAATTNVSSSSDEDESEAEAAPRGRLRKSPLPSRSPSAHTSMLGEKTSLHATKAGEKHYLDVMPTFGRSDANGRGQKHLSPSPDPISRPPSRQSTRFERLKPPRIDVRDASPTGGDVVEEKQQKQSTRPSSLQPVSRQPQRGAHDSDLSEGDTGSRHSSRVSGAASSIAGSLPGNGLATASLPSLPRQFGSTSTATGAGSDRPRWSVSQPAYNHSSLSRRELARLRASMYSSAILAKELSRRANEPRVLAPPASFPSNSERGGAEENDDDDADDEDDRNEGRAVANIGGADKGRAIVRGSNGEGLTWADIAACGPNPAELVSRPIKPVELYPLAAQVLGGAIQRSGQSWQAEAEAFAGTAVPGLRQRIDGVRTRVAVELSGLARQAADEADEMSRDLVAVQRLQVKRVEDSIEKMLRRRRRRFRWVRRAGWLTVEWLLVGFMWYVWFVVMLVRVVLGLGRGMYTGVRWLLWL